MPGHPTEVIAFNFGMWGDITDIIVHVRYCVDWSMQVLVNIHSAHMDPDDWEQPQQFRPERFLDESNNVINRDRIIPFSLGTLTYLLTWTLRTVYSATLLYIRHLININTDTTMMWLCDCAISCGLSFLNMWILQGGWAVL